MTTRTIRETDITITQHPHRAHNDRRFRFYVLLGEREGFNRPVPIGQANNYAAALQARADIIDERAGAAQVGDIVRIGLKGQVNYTVQAILPWGELALRAVGEGSRLAVRYVTTDRAHIVEATR